MSPPRQDWPARNGEAPPRASVVIAAYNCEAFLARTVESIQAQTFANWECVIVDDGSKDGTLELARRLSAEDPRIRAVTQPNAGPSAARNYGASLTHPGSEYITFMDSDDLWRPETLEVMIGEIEKHPDLIGAHARGSCIDEKGRQIDESAYSRHGHGRFICDRFGNPMILEKSMPTTFRSLWFSNPFPPGLVIAKRAVYEKCGYFDPRICPMEDWDMLIRLSRHGGLHYVDRDLISYRRHSGNLSGFPAAINNRTARGLLYKTYFSPENNAAQEEIVRKNWRASQLLFLRKKLAAAGRHLSRGKLGRASWAMMSVCVNCCRFLRGYPTRRGI